MSKNPMNHEMKEVTAGHNFTEKQMQDLFVKAIAEVLKNNSELKTTDPADGSERKDPKTAKPDDILIADDFPQW